MVEAFFAQLNLAPLTPAVVETLEAQLYGSMESKTTRWEQYMAQSQIVMEAVFPQSLSEWTTLMF